MNHERRLVCIAFVRFFCHDVQEAVYPSTRESVS